MKRCKILVVGLIVLLLGSNYTWADEPNSKVDYRSNNNVVHMSDEFGIGAATDSWVQAYGPGGGICALGLLGGGIGFLLLDEPWNYVAAGGGVIVLGLGVWYIIATHNSRVATSINNNAILQHVFFDATSDKLTFGIRFKR
jgi:hypothetical protein